MCRPLAGCHGRRKLAASWPRFYSCQTASQASRPFFLESDHTPRPDEILIDGDAQSNALRNGNRAVGIEFERSTANPAVQLALGDVELDNQRSAERADQVQAICRQQVG